jgi:hypothetical protein
MERASVTECDECEGRESRGEKQRTFSFTFMCVSFCTFQTTNYLFLKVARYGILLCILQEILQEIQFSFKCLFCLEADRQNNTKHYPGAVQVTRS